MAQKPRPTPDKIDVQKVIHALADANVLNLDISLREVIDSPAVGFLKEGLEPWDLICYPWVTLIRRGPRLEEFESIQDRIG